MNSEEGKLLARLDERTEEMRKDIAEIKKAIEDKAEANDRMFKYLRAAVNILGAATIVLIAVTVAHLTSQPIPPAAATGFGVSFVGLIAQHIFLRA